MPEAIFASVSLRASPTAIPAAPRRAIMLVVLTPKRSSIITVHIAYIEYDATVEKTGSSVSSKVLTAE